MLLVLDVFNWKSKIFLPEYQNYEYPGSFQWIFFFIYTLILDFQLTNFGLIVMLLCYLISIHLSDWIVV